MPEYDLAAAEREGLRPIQCPKCRSVLALEEKGGRSVRANNNATVHPTRGRVALRCAACGYVKDWRPPPDSGKPNARK